MSIKINIPGTDRWIESGDHVILVNYPGRVWRCKQGDYVYNNQALFGWHVEDVANPNFDLPITPELLANISVLYNSDKYIPFTEADREQIAKNTADIAELQNLHISNDSGYRSIRQYNADANGSNAAAFNYGKSTGNSSFSANWGEAKGSFSAAFNDGEAIGDDATAFGITTADQSNEVTVGRFNTLENTGALFVVGNGTNNNNTSDAFVVTESETKVKASSTYTFPLKLPCSFFLLS